MSNSAPIKTWGRRLLTAVLTASLAVVATKHVVIRPIVDLMETKTERATCRVVWTDTPIEVIEAHDPLCGDRLRAK